MFPHKQGDQSMSGELLIAAFNTLIALGSGAVLWFIKQSGEAVMAGAKIAAEEGTKTAIKNANWQIELRQEIEKSRGVKRQELKFKSYGSLWNRLRPLAIYSDKPMNRATLGALLDVRGAKPRGRPWLKRGGHGIGRVAATAGSAAGPGHPGGCPDSPRTPGPAWRRSWQARGRHRGNRARRRCGFRH